MAGTRSTRAAVLLFSLWAMTAGAAPTGWVITNAPFRAVVKLSYPSQVPEGGVAITLPEFGYTTAKLADVVLTDAQGEIQPLAAVWRGEGQDILLLAKEMNKNQEYYVYFGANRPQPVATWSPLISLLLETRRSSAGGELGTWESMDAAWRTASETDGAGWVRYIYHGLNPFGDSSHFLTHYTGYLRTEKFKELTLYTMSSDASFVLVNGKFEFGWPGEHPADSNARNVHAKTVSCSGPLTRIDYYHAKTGKGAPTMALGWKQGEKFEIVPDDMWVHPGSAKLVRIEQAQGLPVPLPVVTVRSYVGYADLWLYELSGALRTEPPEGWTVQWKFADGMTINEREFTRVVIGGESQWVTVKLQRGRDELTGKRRVSFIEGLRAVSVKDAADFRVYLDAIARENPGNLSPPLLRSYVAFLHSVEQEQIMARFADAWLKTNPDPTDVLWLPAQQSRLRGLAQTDPQKALAELRNITPGVRTKYAGALDMLELELLVFHLNDPSVVARAAQISMRDPKSETARLSQVRVGDFYRLQGRYPEAIAQYQLAQRSVVEESAGRKLPAQDRAYSITINDLLERGDYTEADQKLAEWEARHPMAKLDSDFLVLRGRVLMAFGRWREALAEIASFVKLQPDNPYQIDADFYRARAMFELGQKDEARKIWGEIAQKYPRHPLAGPSKEWAAKP